VQPELGERCLAARHRPGRVLTPAPVQVMRDQGRTRLLAGGILVGDGLPVVGGAAGARQRDARLALHPLDLVGHLDRPGLVAVVDEHRTGAPQRLPQATFPSTGVAIGEAGPQRREVVVQIDLDVDVLGEPDAASVRREDARAVPGTVERGAGLAQRLGQGPDGPWRVEVGEQLLRERLA
jgi:hypothetical protein